ncbi:MAG TPA: hypothetical protein VHN37_02970 [Actinomycetota bacterium]|nr:hypothetical protein [Actinomycetota bacterium]
MTKENQHERPHGDEASVIDRLRWEIGQLDSVDSADDLVEHELVQLLHSGHAVMTSDVQRAIDQLLRPGEGLSPLVREKLLAAVKRALAERGGAIPLPARLERARMEMGLSPSSLAERLSLDEKAILAFERGEKRLTETSPAVVASWIRLVDAERDDVLPGIAAALGRLRPEPTYADSEASLELSAEDEKFARAVLSEFDAWEEPNPASPE